MAVYNTLLVDMAASGSQAAVFKGESRDTLSRLDRGDLGALSIIHNAFNDGRSVARVLMYSMLGYPQMQPNPAVAFHLAFFEQTVPPKAADADESTYIRKTTTLVASDSGVFGLLAAAGLPAAVGCGIQLDAVPLGDPEQREVVRHFCLFCLSKDVLEALVRHAHELEPDVIMCVAECFRACFVAERDAWTEAMDVSPESDASKGPSCWVLLMPRLGKRAQLDKTIQQLKGAEIAAPADFAAAATEASVDVIVENAGADDVDELGT